MSINTGLLESIGTLADNLGGAGFHASMLEVFGTLIPGDESQTYYYWPDGRAHCLHAIDTPYVDCDSYTTDFSFICPFFHFWKRHQRPVIAWLDRVVDKDASDQNVDRFFSEFYAPLGLNDEIGVFMPTPTRRTIGLFVQRSGYFDENNLEDVNQIFPALVRMHRANNRLLLHGYTNPHPDNAEPKPVRFVDRYGFTVFENFSWRSTPARQLRRFDAAIAAMDHDTSVRRPLDDDGTMTRFELDEGFPLAPGGAAYVFEAGPGALANRPLDLTFLSGVLSSREQDIVGLALQGHPVRGIADSLGISPNTVKVHRQRIFEKLDITTERELFLIYIAHRETQWQKMH